MDYDYKLEPHDSYAEFQLMLALEHQEENGLTKVNRKIHELTNLFNKVGN